MTCRMHIITSVTPTLPSGLKTSLPPALFVLATLTPETSWTSGPPTLTAIHSAISSLALVCGPARYDPPDGLMIAQSGPDHVPANLSALLGGDTHHIATENMMGEIMSESGDGPDMAALDWVITGGESGRRARPMHPDWARSLRDQCVAAEVPFFFKQWGAWGPGVCIEGKMKGRKRDAAWFVDQWIFDYTDMDDPEHKWHQPADLYFLGKKATGRLLDGREWNEVPG